MVRKNRAVCRWSSRGAGAGGDADFDMYWPHQPAGWLVVSNAMSRMAGKI